MKYSTNCEGFSRRHCLRLGLGGLMGASFVNSLRLQALAATKKAKAKACILVWMDGGPTHFETFDPKPDAPAEIRGEWEPIATKVPGVFFSQHMKKLAGSLDKFTMVRSIRHNQGNHGAGNHYMMTGSPPRIPVSCGAFVSFHPSLGSVVSKQLGRNKPNQALPGYISTPRMSRSGGPNFLGAKYAPFVIGDDPNTKNFRVRDISPPKELLGDRFNQRTDIRKLLDKVKRLNDSSAGDPVVAMDEYYRQGYRLINSQQAQAALDINRETPKTRESYGRDSFGQRCLLARRLVEAGVPFVTVYDGGWDSHSGLFENLGKRLPRWDNSVATLINDLDERGLLDSTLVLALGEFGRTPKITKLSGRSSPGRDHWANAMSVLMAGGGIPGGTVVGSTDRTGHSANRRVCSPENFASTVYTKLGIDPATILYTPQGRPTHLVSDPTPIRELV